MTTIKSILRIQRNRLVVTVLAAALAVGWATAPARADPITDDNVDAAVAAAKTAADHEALATYFTGKSKAALAAVEMHKKMSRAFSGKAATSWEAHCQSLIKTFQEQAKDYDALAKEQAALAKGMQHGM